MYREYLFTVSMAHVVQAIPLLPKDVLLPGMKRRRAYGKRAILRAGEELKSRLGEHLLGHQWKESPSGEVLELRLRLPDEPAGWYHLRTDLEVFIATFLLSGGKATQREPATPW